MRLASTCGSSCASAMGIGTYSCLIQRNNICACRSLNGSVIENLINYNLIKPTSFYSLRETQLPVAVLRGRPSVASENGRTVLRDQALRLSKNGTSCRAASTGWARCAGDAGRGQSH